MIRGRLASAALLSFFAFTLTASAQMQCGGSLKKEDFFEHSRAHNAEMQQNILKARKIQDTLERGSVDAAQAAELQKEFAVLKGQIAEQKKVYEEFNTPHFATTYFTVYGAACNDRRWVNRAKDILWKEPQHLGKTFHVWLDKDTREVEVAQQPPNLARVAK